MAIMLPVGPGGPVGDSSPKGAPESPPSGTKKSTSSDGGANNSPKSTGTLSGTSESQSFHDTLTSTQQENDSKPSAKNRKEPAAQPNAVAVPIPNPYQAQQAALSLAAPAKQSAAETVEAAGAKTAAEIGNQETDAEAGMQAKPVVDPAVTAEAAAQAKPAVDPAPTVAAQEAASIPAVADPKTNAEAGSGESQETQNGSVSSSESSSDLHSLSSPTQTLAHADAAAAAVHSESKQGSSDSQGGSSDTPPQMNWTPASAISAGPPASGFTPDAKVAGAGMAERVDVVRQIATQFAASTPLPSNGQHTVTLNIHPDHWGELTINLTMDDASGPGQSSAGGGAITATIVAQTSAVRDALIGQSKDLQSALESSGIKLQKLDIITAGAAAGTVAAGHSASQSGFNANSNGNSSGQQSQQSHSNATSQDTSGQQGQRQPQQFESMFGGSGQNQAHGGWLPSIAPAQGSPESQSFTPIGLAQATSSEINSGGINVLA